MNENIDLTKILKNCPKGTKLYSTILGDVKFCYIDESEKYPIKLTAEGEYGGSVSAKGKHLIDFNGECTVFPSKEQRDWSNFTAPWYKKEKFDPKTLKPFDKVITKFSDYPWKCDIFSYYRERENKIIACYCTSEDYVYDRCIPYNDDTKHLVGTKEDCPEYYKWWEE